MAPHQLTMRAPRTIARLPLAAINAKGRLHAHRRHEPRVGRQARDLHGRAAVKPMLGASAIRCSAPTTLAEITAKLARVPGLASAAKPATAVGAARWTRRGSARSRPATLRKQLDELIAADRRARWRLRRDRRGREGWCACSATSAASCATSSTSRTSTASKTRCSRPAPCTSTPAPPELCIWVSRRGQARRAGRAAGRVPGVLLDHCVAARPSSIACAHHQRRQPTTSSSVATASSTTARATTGTPRSPRSSVQPDQRARGVLVAVQEVHPKAMEEMVGKRASRPTRPRPTAKIELGRHRHRQRGPPPSRRRPRPRPRRFDRRHPSPPSASRSAASAPWWAASSAPCFGPRQVDAAGRHRPAAGDQRGRRCCHRLAQAAQAQPWADPRRQQLGGQRPLHGQRAAGRQAHQDRAAPARHHRRRRSRRGQGAGRGSCTSSSSRCWCSPAPGTSASSTATCRTARAA
jgi:hypothetical protein